MNWVGFVVLAWLGLGFEVGVRDALRLGSSTVAPSFVVPLLVYISLSATPRAAAWAAVILGLLMDLAWLLTRTDGMQAHLIGPYAIGMLVAGQFVLAVRGLVIRHHFFAHAVLGVLAAGIVHVVVVGMLAIRSIAGEPIRFAATEQLQSRLLSAVFTGGLALILSFVFVRLDGVMGFHLDRGGRHAR